MSKRFLGRKHNRFSSPNYDAAFYLKNPSLFPQKFGLNAALLHHKKPCKPLFSLAMLHYRNFYAAAAFIIH
jgi:hypothetical protein